MPEILGSMPEAPTIDAENSGIDAGGVYHRWQKFGDRCWRRLPSMLEIRGSMLEAPTIDARNSGINAGASAIDAENSRIDPETIY
ncbi:MAG TPA: hypothetical protein VNA69_01560 [Thermoanaerobaculia bacterium]|nr:hypothetical protein [Thermoanaerobaculia bacterium]